MKIKPRKHKIHSLTGRITPEMMVKAWKAVKKNRGAAGIDKITIELYAKNLDEGLMSLMKKLKTRGSYQPIPLKRVHIPKGKGKTRPLGIPTVSTRIGQEVIRRLINPIFEKQFHENSYGFRPGRNCHQAVRKVQDYIKEGYRYIVDADIKGFFDNIPHKLIMTLIRSEIADGNILDIIEKFLRSGVMEEGRLKPTTKGTPQGGVISPLLANIVLNQLDWELDSQGYKFVRYADDFVILCKSKHEAEKALLFATDIIERELGLELSPEKTKISHMKEGFEFLGFQFKNHKIGVRNKSEEKLRDKIREITKRSRNLDAEVIEKLNRTIRGTVNYFCTSFTNTLTFFTKIDEWIRERIRSMKFKRKWKTDHRRLKNKHIERLGLLSCRSLCFAAIHKGRDSPERGNHLWDRPVREIRMPVNMGK